MLNLFYLQSSDIKADDLKLEGVLNVDQSLRKDMCDILVIILYIFNIFSCLCIQ